MNRIKLLDMRKGEIGKDEARVVRGQPGDARVECQR